MHIQARAKPAKSAPDLEAFFKVLSEPTPGRTAINIEGVTGSDVETGGEIVFTFDHDREADVRAWLDQENYKDVTFLNAEAGEIFWAELSENTPGQLLQAIRSASTENLPSGKLIKDVVIGQETQPPHRFYVQISFQEVKTSPRT